MANSVDPDETARYEPQNQDIVVHMLIDKQQNPSKLW